MLIFEKTPQGKIRWRKEDWGRKGMLNLHAACFGGPSKSQSYILLFRQAAESLCSLPLHCDSERVGKSSDSYPHALEPWQGSQGPQSSQGSQRLNGTKIWKPNGIGYQTDQWDLKHTQMSRHKERRHIMLSLKRTSCKQRCFNLQQQWWSPTSTRHLWNT